MVRRSLAPLLLALFTCSGVAGLVLEAVLLRELAWLAGSSSVATAIVLAAFMGGLALGAALLGPLADRTARPLALFGVLEVVTALCGASLAWLLGAGREWLLAPLRAAGPAPAGQRLAVGVLAFALVLAPTLPMGGTLPALGRLWIRRDPSRFAGRLGLLYGVNTLGGAIGIFVAGFFLFERFGVAGSAYVAAAAQVVVGAVALISDRALRPAAAQTSPAPPADAVAKDNRGPRRASLLAACAGGGVVLGYEVLWTRLLSLPMRSFSYSFSLMLALFLAGLCIGALLVPLLARGGARPVVVVGWLQVAMGAWVAATLPWLPALLAPAEGATSFAGFLARGVLRAIPVVLPPTILSGAVLPLAARGFAPDARHVGRDVGLVYALNTAGGIVGSLLAGLVLLPALGARASLVSLAVVNAVTGAAVLALATRRAVPAAVAGAVAAACALPLAAGGRPFVEAFLRATSSHEKIGELLYFHEGATDTVAVVRKEYGFHDPEAKSLITNGVAMSATVKPVWRYMALEGHLPLLLGADPRRALAVGVGTGITLGALVSHPELESIDAIELSRGVVGGLPQFAAENGRAWEDPRVRLRVEDGRHWLELSDTAYDVITIEPPPPIVAGSVQLYSLDFYRLCLRRLRPGGVVAQWLPLHSQSTLSARMSVRSFLDAFPHAALWFPSAQDAVLVGSAEPLRIDLGRLHAAYTEPRTRANLEQAYLETPAALLGSYLLDRAGLERWVGDVPQITDEHPRMEFFRNQGGNMHQRDRLPLIDLPQPELPFDADPELAERVALENRALRLYLRAVALGDPAAGGQAVRLSRGTEFYLYRMGCASAQLAGLDPSAASLRAAQCARMRDAGVESE